MRFTPWRRSRFLALVLASGLACAPTACSKAAEPRSADPATSRPAPATAAAALKVVILGDSLTAGLGLDAGDAFPSVLERRLRSAGLPVSVVNAGVSGDTTAGGLRRLEWALDDRVRVLVVALGGNDALRGLPVADLQRNLSEIIERAQSRGISVILAGMEAPPNLGPAYTSAFRAAYRDLAMRDGVTFVPFLLAGVAGDPALNQADGIHPNAEGARRVADLLWPSVETAVRAAVQR